MSQELANIPKSEWNKLPALKPPPGVKSNFRDPADKGPALVGVASAFLGLMLVFFTCRVYSKAFIIRKLSWGDLPLSLGLIGAVACYVGFVWGAVKGPTGKHQYDITLAQGLSDDMIIPSFMELVLIKLSLFLLYLEIFWPMRWLRRSVYTGATLQTAFYGAITVGQFVFASPRRGQSWQQHWVSVESTKADALSIPLAAVGLGIDIFLLVLPIRAVAQLQLPTKRKVGVSAVFATGLLACIGSLISVYFRVVDARTQDKTWNIIAVEVAVIIEMYVGIIVVCMPAASTVARHHRPRLERLSSCISSRLSILRRSSSSNGKNISSSTPSAENISGEKRGGGAAPRLGTVVGAKGQGKLTTLMGVIAKVGGDREGDHSSHTVLGEETTTMLESRIFADEDRIYLTKEMGDAV